LKILEDAGLVTSHKDGLWVNCQLSDGAGSRYAAYLLGNLKYWLEENPEVAGSALSLPNMLVIGGVMGVKKTATFCAIIVVLSTTEGMCYGWLTTG